MTDEEVLEFARQLKMPHNLMTNKIMWADKLIALANHVENEVTQRCEERLEALYRKYAAEQDFDACDVIQQCCLALQEKGKP
jgi:hypothetical protein